MKINEFMKMYHEAYANENLFSDNYYEVFNVNYETFPEYIKERSEEMLVLIEDGHVTKDYSDYAVLMEKYKECDELNMYRLLTNHSSNTNDTYGEDERLALAISKVSGTNGTEYAWWEVDKHIRCINACYFKNEEDMIALFVRRYGTKLGMSREQCIQISKMHEEQDAEKIEQLIADNEASFEAVDGAGRLTFTFLGETHYIAFDQYAGVFFYDDESYVAEQPTSYDNITGTEAWPKLKREIMHKYAARRAYASSGDNIEYVEYNEQNMPERIGAKIEAMSWQIGEENKKFTKFFLAKNDYITKWLAAHEGAN